MQRRLDRLGRSLRHLIDTIGALQERVIGFKSLQEQIDTITSGGKLVFHVFGDLAEFERDLIRERTLAGLDAARARGRLGGRPKALDERKSQMARALYSDKSNSIADIGRTLRISRATLYRYLKARPDGAAADAAASSTPATRRALNRQMDPWPSHKRSFARRRDRLSQRRDGLSWGPPVDTPRRL